MLRYALNQAKAVGLELLSGDNRWAWRLALAGVGAAGLLLGLQA
jgi:hypothetical protein